MRSVLLLALIVYRFDSPVPPALLEAMEDETSAILGQSGIEFTWWNRDSAATVPNAREIFVLRFRGRCGPSPGLRMRPGPLAFTHIADGEVLPFGDVDCDQVRASVSHALWARNSRQSEVVFGRALGRVAAHELVHIITRSRTHGHRGVAQPAFSGRDLTADEFTLAPEDVDRVRDCFR